MNDNALAGPSSVFLPPAKLSTRPPPALSSTKDLLSTFGLLPAYDRYVRPFASLSSPIPASQDKGKAPERFAIRSPTPLPVPTPQHTTSGLPLTPSAQDANDADDDDNAQGGEKKLKNTYKHLIRGIPGKHSTKKDDVLSNTILAPPKQRIPIIPFDDRTQRDAFAVSLEGLKAWNPSLLILETAQAREDRKKRKELKKLARLQHQQQPQQQQQPTQQHQPPHQQPPPPPTTTPVLPSQQVHPAAQAQPPLRHRHPTPQAPALPARLKASATPRPAPPALAPPTPTSIPTRKRDFESLAANPEGAANVIGVAGARAGVVGARPRPVKKQRLDLQGQAREALSVQQQPTPQGV